MSLKLLKQSLDIIEEDTKQKKSKIDKHHKNTNKLHKIDYKSKANEPRFSKLSKKSFEDVKHELNSSNKKTEENIKRLLALSMNTVKVNEAENIIKRAHRGRYVEKVVPKVEQESIFTEEDFRKFEEEYFNS